MAPEFCPSRVAKAISGWGVAALSAILLVLSFLLENNYPLICPESLLLFILFFAFLAVLWRLSIWPHAEWFFYLVLAVSILDWGLGVSEKRGYAAIGAVFLAMTIPCYFFREKLKAALWMGLTVAIITGVATSFISPPRLTRSEKIVELPIVAQKPNVYIFFLDEHIGLDGLPLELGAESRLLREELITRYSNLGFELYPAAFSNYNATLTSIPSILSLSFPERRRDAPVHEKKLLKNVIFRKISQEGYRIHVYQSSHLLYDHDTEVKPSDVWTYKESSAGYLAQAPFPWFQKFQVLLNNLFEGQHSQWIKKGYRFFSPIPPEDKGGYMLGAMAAPVLLEKMRDDIKDHPKSTLFFAHLLTPHSSYIYDAEGGLLSFPFWVPNHGEILNDAGRMNSEKKRLEKYKLYFGQIRYLHVMLEDFFDYLRREDLFEEAHIVLVSDHGSRIYRTLPRRVYEGNLVLGDFKDAYSAFAAVKPSKGSIPKEESLKPKPISIAALLADQFNIEIPHPETLSKVYYDLDDESFMSQPASILNG